MSGAEEGSAVTAPCEDSSAKHGQKVGIAAKECVKMASKGLKDTYVTEGDADESPSGTPPPILPPAPQTEVEAPSRLEVVEPAGQPVTSSAACPVVPL